MRFTLATSIVALAVVAAAAPQPTVQRVGAAIPISKRSSLNNTDGSFNREALKAHVESVKAKVLRGFTNYEKNTGTPHPSAPKGVEKRASGIPLTNSNNRLWFGTVSIGTPLTDFTVDFDTGSSDFFVPGVNCDSTCNSHTLWDPSTSSTSQDLGITFSVEFGDGSTADGEQFSDVVSMAGLTANPQTVGVASTYSNTLSSSPADGLLGLGYPSISKFPASPVFQSIVDQSQGQVDPVFSFKLSDARSELFVGGVNTNLFTGDFSFTPVTQQGFWQVNMDDVQGNGQVLLSNVDSVIDTAATLIMGIPSDVSSLYGTLGGTAVGDGFYTFPCDSFPTISLTFGGTTFPILASALNLGPDPSSSSPDCVSGLVEGDPADSFWIIGDVFLQGVYTTFDLGINQVGFAQLA